MAQYIDKDALVAEIERRISLYKGLSAYTVNPNRIDEDEQILSFINTLEVKEEDDMTANGYVKYPRKEFF